jgi:hypothetical protein
MVAPPPLDPTRYQNGTAGRFQAPPGMSSGSPAAASQSGDFVYFGTDPKTNRPDFKTKSNARNAWLFLPDKTKAMLSNQMDAAFGQNRWDNRKLEYYWGKSIDAANYALYQLNQLISPLDTFGQIIGEEMKASGGGGGGGGGGTSVTTQMRLTDPATARGLVDNALSTYLGREADPKEQQAFLKALNVQEQRNPTVTTTSATGAGATSVTTGGFNPTTFAEEWARGEEGSAEFQTATTFLDAFMSALKPVA